MFSFRFLLVFIVGIVINSVSVMGFAQDDEPKPKPAPKKVATQKAVANNGKGPAYTQPPKGDPSFLLMGEFVGKVKTDSGEKLVGLQVRVIGDDQFDAVAYHGGLPGQPNHEPKAVPMIGRRSGEFLILSGGPWAILVEKNSCRVINRKGKTIGQLKRIKRSSPTLHSPPPPGALVLFDGTNTEQFTKADMTPEGLLMQGASLKPMFQDFNLHIEFRLPYMPLADSQKRGNSGLYLQNRYECQILDSFATLPVINGCGSLYRFKAPDLNMCLPPLVWQTYDVQFTAPRWAADGTKIRNATITSWLNGIKVQDNVSLSNKTGAGKIEEPILLATKFQDHGDPVRFRNAWIVDRGLVLSEFPVKSTKKQRADANQVFQQRAKAARKKIAMEKRAKAKLEKQKKEAEKKEAEKKEADKKANEKKPVPTKKLNESKIR